jgi:hypothetical protein
VQHISFSASMNFLCFRTLACRFESNRAWATQACLLSGRAEQRGNANAFDDSDYYSDSASDRRSAGMALQFRWGYYPGGGLGLILIIVIVLALMGRV